MDNNDIARICRENAKLLKKLASNCEELAQAFESEPDVSAQRGGGNGRPPGG